MIIKFSPSDASMIVMNYILQSTMAHSILVGRAGQMVDTIHLVLKIFIQVEAIIQVAYLLIFKWLICNS